MASHGPGHFLASVHTGESTLLATSPEGDEPLHLLNFYKKHFALQIDLNQTRLCVAIDKTHLRTVICVKKMSYRVCLPQSVARQEGQQ